MHISHSVAISMFPYLEIMFEDNELAWEISDFLGFEEDEIKRFRSRKIPKKVIEKMEKQKAQKRVEERDARAEEIKTGLMAGIPTKKEPEKEEDKPKKKTDKQVSLFNF